jgi:hypothetical protein
MGERRSLLVAMLAATGLLIVTLVIRGLTGAGWAEWLAVVSFLLLGLIGFGFWVGLRWMLVTLGVIVTATLLLRLLG